MTNITTGTTGGEQKRRTPTKCAGEMTLKRNIGVEGIAKPPPTFGNPKIDGAGFLSREFDIKDSGRVDQAKLWRDIGGVNAERYESQPVIPNEAHSLAAQPGWRRVWISLTHLKLCEYSNLDDILISDLCKACFDAKEKCSHPKLSGLGQINGKTMRSPWKCLSCDFQGQHCLLLISYKASTEGSPVNSRVFEFERVRENNIGSPLEVPTSAVDYVMPPQWLRRSVHLEQTGAKKKVFLPPKPRPTYSQCRDTYKRLTEEYYHEQFRNRWVYPCLSPRSLYAGDYLKGDTGVRVEIKACDEMQVSDPEDEDIKDERNL